MFRRSYFSLPIAFCLFYWQMIGFFCILSKIPTNFLQFFRTQKTKSVSKLTPSNDTTATEHIYIFKRNIYYIEKCCKDLKTCFREYNTICNAISNYVSPTWFLWFFKERLHIENNFPCIFFSGKNLCCILIKSCFALFFEERRSKAGATVN